MNKASPQMRSLAKQLQALETQAPRSAEGANPAAFVVIDKLRPHLSMLMGRVGFQALFARALVLASGEVPWLAAVRVVEDGELDRLMVAQTTSAADVSEGEVVLLAQLFGLLTAFIGAALTLRLIRQIWPGLSFNAADFTNTPKNKEAK